MYKIFIKLNISKKNIFATKCLESESAGITFMYIKFSRKYKLAAIICNIYIYIYI